MAATLPITLTSIDLDLQQLHINPEAYRFTGEALISDEIQERNIRDIQQLNDSVHKAKTIFREISDDLMNFDAREYQDKDGSPIELYKMWKKHYTRFKDLVDDADDTSLKAAAVLRQYEVILRDIRTGVDCNVITARMNNFVEKMNQKGDDAQKMKRGFEDLADEIYGFQAKMDEGLDKAREGLNKNKLDTLQKNLKTLRTDLKKISKELIEFESAWFSTISVGASQATLALFALSPAAMNSAMNSVMDKVNYNGKRKYMDKVEKRKELTSELALYQTKLEAEIARHRDYPQFKKDLARSEDIATVVKRLAVIANVWRGIKADILDLANQLDLANDVDESLEMRVSTTRELYTSLADLLKQYASGRGLRG